MVEVSEGNRKHYYVCFPCSCCLWLLLKTGHLSFDPGLIGNKKWCNRETDWKDATKSTIPLPTKGTIHMENNIWFKSLSHLMKLGGNITNLSWPQSVTIWSDREDSVLWGKGIVERNCAHSHTNNKVASNFVYILSCSPAHPLACFISIPWLLAAVQIIQDKNHDRCLHRAPHSREHLVQASGLYQNRNVGE